MTSPTLDVRDVTWAPRKRDPLLLEATSFSLNKGEVMGLVGPNGAGKTTLLRLIYGYNRPLSGDILLDGESLRKMAPRALAKKVAAVLQEQPSDFALTVREVVALGRVPHRLGLSTPGQHDAEVIEAALKRLQLQDLSHRSLSTLSGGERQRVMVARALAQEPQLLVLDEPTNHLDIRHQLEVLQLIRDLDLTIVTSLHDLNLAADVCDRILILKNGAPKGFGAPMDVLKDRLVSETFQVRAQREQLSVSQKNHLTFQL
ncbi:ABC transporter ATP-binding protein [Shimia sp. R10_1]|uniref:ABC transporter ATP-binding protein n=1 Tax=Shimia sp. R10_1 TaxID=2821095 RepID=UPI001ADABA50|nr:ABC transporter ATP-binding protein [Shimia sp. R10_1]MBO9474235.1 ABC transporter ATP-binding protein [Shimia sp. R10_1]